MDPKLEQLVRLAKKTYSQNEGSVIRAAYGFDFKLPPPEWKDATITRGNVLLVPVHEGRMAYTALEFDSKGHPLAVVWECPWWEEPRCSPVVVDSNAACWRFACRSQS